MTKFITFFVLLFSMSFCGAQDVCSQLKSMVEYAKDDFRLLKGAAVGSGKYSRFKSTENLPGARTCEIKSRKSGAVLECIWDRISDPPTQAKGMANTVGQCFDRKVRPSDDEGSEDKTEVSYYFRLPDGVSISVSIGNTLVGENRVALDIRHRP